jgi:hypothetical protein
MTSANYAPNSVGRQPDTGDMRAARTIAIAGPLVASRPIVNFDDVSLAGAALTFVSFARHIGDLTK